MNSETGWTTIEEVRGTVDNTYSRCQLRTKIELKSWLYHSEKCHEEGAYPLPFMDYVSRMSDKDYLEQVKLDEINCEDLGGKGQVIDYLTKRMNR
ncbi:hypothetical protein K8O68_07470 [Salipaludibacillus sp. CUR1]|uniref:hypothetical protein n=1 Tax=Salipaludibacillus sp. CUR1 TaxID=2820003 RepID=UPI001E36E77C|nr:hypothetical protein [Salipaludibacillus sp. CUR1]MCE7792265.1 hypothetical protein [Salipaludibacillus sp. CUR1]